MEEELLLPISPLQEGTRLDRFLTENTEGMTRSYLQKLITRGLAGLVMPDGSVKALAKAGAKLKGGDMVRLLLPEPEAPDILPEDIPLDIVYEDADVILINKPKGMVVHPAPGHTSGTLVNALLYHCAGSLSGINGVLRPGIVHRIDKDTTGLLIACKNDEAHLSLAAQLKAHSITRRYQAVVYGNFREEEGTVDAPIGRDPRERKRMAVTADGREAITHYRVMERFGAYAHIGCRLETGRTHQIRVHLSHIGHPLLGDTVYGPAKCPYALVGQTLHAAVFGFAHPRTGEYMEFSAPLPAYFSRLLDILRLENAH